MKRTSLFALFAPFILLLIASPLNAQTLTPPDARATLTMARAQATAVSEQATANAPTSTATATMTPQPTDTATMEPTNTAHPTATPTMQPSATPLPIVATAAARTIAEPAIDDRRGGVPVELWCIVGILLMCAGIGAGMRMVSKWRR